MPRPLRLEVLEDRATPAAVGALDPSFGASGKVIDTALAGPRFNSADAVVIQPDGKLVIAAGTGLLGNQDFGVLRLNPDGTPDPTFGPDGKRTIGFDRSPDPNNDDRPSDIVLQPDGKIVVVGTVAEDGDEGDFGVVRLNADGTPDETFGPGGKRVIAFDVRPNSLDQVKAVSLQPDGKIVIAGETHSPNPTRFDFAFARLNPDGTPDESFGPGGKRSLTFDIGSGSYDILYDMTVQPDGKIVAVGDIAGISTSGTAGRMAVARLNADGTPDESFGPGGKRTVSFDPNNVLSSAADAVLVQPDGKIVVAGTNESGQLAGNVAVARLNPDGTPDESFGPGGKRVYALTPGVGDRGFAYDAALLPDGRIVLAGALERDIGILRLNPDGTPDESFGPGGFQSVAFDVGGSNTDTGYGVAVDGNGRVVVAGTATLDGTVTMIALRLIGSVEKGEVLTAGGPTDATAAVFAPTAGVLPGAPSATVVAFGSGAVNVRTAVADVNGDGFDDTVLVTGPGTPIRVAVVSGRDDTTVLVAPFDPFGGDFLGGGFVAAGDFDLDGRAEFVVTPDQGGGPRVTVFALNADGTTAVKANFFGIDDPSFRGGARAAVGDVNGDGVPDVAVAAGFLGGPRAALFDGKTLFATPSRLVNDFFAFPGADAERLRNGAHVAAGDVDGDGFADLIFGGGPGGAPRVFVLGGVLVSSGDVAGAQINPVANYFVAGNSSDRGGVRVAAADLDGDQKADVVVGSGEGRPAGLRAYLGKHFNGSNEPATFQDVGLFGGAALPGGVFVG